MLVWLSTYSKLSLKTSAISPSGMQFESRRKRCRIFLEGNQINLMQKGHSCTKGGRKNRPAAAPPFGKSEKLQMSQSSKTIGSHLRSKPGNNATILSRKEGAETSTIFLAEAGICENEKRCQHLAREDSR